MVEGSLEEGAEIRRARRQRWLDGGALTCGAGCVLWPGILLSELWVVAEEISIPLLWGSMLLWLSSAALLLPLSALALWHGLGPPASLRSALRAFGVLAGLFAWWMLFAMLSSSPYFHLYS